MEWKLLGRFRKYKDVENFDLFKNATVLGASSYANKAFAVRSWTLGRTVCECGAIGSFDTEYGFYRCESCNTGNTIELNNIKSNSLFKAFNVDSKVKDNIEIITLTEVAYETNESESLIRLVEGKSLVFKINLNTLKFEETLENYTLTQTEELFSKYFQDLDLNQFEFFKQIKDDLATLDSTFGYMNVWNSGNSYRNVEPERSKAVLRLMKLKEFNIDYDSFVGYPSIFFNLYQGFELNGDNDFKLNNFKNFDSFKRYYKIGDTEDDKKIIKVLEELPFEFNSYGWEKYDFLIQKDSLDKDILKVFYYFIDEIKSYNYYYFFKKLTDFNTDYIQKYKYNSKEKDAILSFIYEHIIIKKQDVIDFTIYRINRLNDKGLELNRFNIHNFNESIDSMLLNESKIKQFKYSKFLEDNEKMNTLDAFLELGKENINKEYTLEELEKMIYD